MSRRHTPSVLVLLLLFACGTQAPPAAPEPDMADQPVATPPAEAPVVPTTPVEANVFGFDAAPTDQVTLVAMARGETDVFAHPGDTDPVVTLPRTTIVGTVTVLTAIGEPLDGWVEVMLPMRPNGSTGWVSVEAVDLYVVEGEIVVDLTHRRLTYYRHGEEVLTSSVAIGTSSNPTPTGTFFVTDSITLSNPNSPWGPHALGLSARSDTITEYNGGDGIIGIHGTNKPSSIGKAASLGCIRLPNDVITQLHSLVPIGTPVVVRG